ncbi:hypothetical protein Tco_1573490 [Tanacetum coccineum]
MEMENDQQVDNVDANGDNGNAGELQRNRRSGWFNPIHISNCPPRYQVKYETCALLDGALTWYNSHKRTVGVDDAYAMKWKELMLLMTKVYCPRNEIQKMETEL